MVHRLLIVVASPVLELVREGTDASIVRVQQMWFLGSGAKAQ